MTIGVFDGVHLGHSYIIKKTVECARLHHLVSTALIFERPYRAVSGKEFEGLLTTARQRKQLLHSMGIAEVKIQQLEKIMEMEASDFISFIVEKFRPKCVHIGHDFSFGKGARGDAKMLEEFGKKMGFSVDIIPKIVKNGNRISSTIVRRTLKRGNPEEAATYLGRHFCIIGKVFKERGLGSKIGFPTANIRRDKSLIVPKLGVYLVRSVIDGKEIYGLLNVGTRPTVDEDKEVKYEVHFLVDTLIELTGKELKLELLSFLREEKRFFSLDELKTAIRADVEKARNILEL